MSLNEAVFISLYDEIADVDPMIVDNALREADPAHNPKLPCDLPAMACYIYAHKLVTDEVLQQLEQDFVVDFDSIGMDEA